MSPRGHGGGPKPRPAEALHSVAVTVRLTPGEAAALDTARGAVPRAEWVREAAMDRARPRQEPGPWEGMPGDIHICWWPEDSHGWRSGAAEAWPDGRWTAWTPQGAEIASAAAPTQPEAEAAARAALAEYVRRHDAR